MSKFLLTAALVGTTDAISTVFSGLSTQHHLFGEWKAKFGKVYDTPEAEAEAQAAFNDNHAIIQEYNAKYAAGEITYYLGHNEFSGMSWETFSRGRLGHSGEKVPAEKVHQVRGNAPSEVDWVSAGAVTPVKNQEQCGSCWAFSSTGAMEGDLFVETGTLMSLSEEQLVQCDSVDDGCQGGLMDNAFKWVKSNGGICSEDDYSYTSGSGTTGSCKKTCSPVMTIKSFTDVTSEDEEALLDAVAQQPVSVALEADKSVFQLYSGGVLDSTTCGTQLDHGVLIVGYGTDSGVDYWKVKNSWGETWGSEGYLQIVRGKNMCGIATQPSYPTGAKKLSPGPGPGPSPPSPPADTHYEDPSSAGCLDDEIEVTIEDVDGDVCAPSCSLFKPCPTDVPDGVTAEPQCALQDAGSGKQYCALVCSPTAEIVDQQAADAQCGENASCKSVQMGIGICTYDDR